MLRFLEGARSWGCEEHLFMEEDAYRRVLALEAQRTKRNGQPSVLMILDVEVFAGMEGGERAVKRIGAVLSSCTRETDAKGWLNGKASVGILLSGLSDQATTLEDLYRGVSTRIWSEMKRTVGEPFMDGVLVYYSVFPWGIEGADGARTLSAEALRQKEMTSSQVALGKAM